MVAEDKVGVSLGDGDSDGDGDGDGSGGDADADVTNKSPDATKPLVSLSWRDVQVTATVVGVANSVCCEIFPKLDDRLPHRRGVRTAFHLAPKGLGVAARVAGGRGRGGVGAVQGGAVAMRHHHHHHHVGVSAGALHGLAHSSRIIGKSRPVVSLGGRMGQQGGGASAALPAVHRRIHVGNGMAKNLQCPICQKPFTKTTYLKRHILSHSGVKPYKCDICGWGEQIAGFFSPPLYQ